MDVPLQLGLLSWKVSLLHSACSPRHAFDAPRPQGWASLFKYSSLHVQRAQSPQPPRRSKRVNFSHPSAESPSAELPPPESQLPLVAPWAGPAISSLLRKKVGIKVAPLLRWRPDDMCLKFLLIYEFSFFLVLHSFEEKADLSCRVSHCLESPVFLCCLEIWTRC